ncbi:MAG: UDP-diphospho-muramoylpentapeptide beta-N-acetylglucosaminyltransferase [Firmicutes bacterium]|nr:UDP-diphospho-muramoylpentapeptide beta-N-acetylglucosaminyltransferase [Bacillota bacterium]
MKILILTGKFGMGHYSAALTLAEQIKAFDPHIEITVKDIYEIAYPDYCEMFYRSYMSLVSKGCKLYNFAYKKAVHSKLLKKKDRNSNKSQWQKGHIVHMLGKTIQELSPDVIISTYSLCARFAADYKQISGHNIPLITCVTDVSIHNVWINPGTDIYLVGARETKDSLIDAGVRPEQIFVSGIPVKSVFGQAEDAETAQGSKTKEILIMGGGLGLLPRQNRFYEELAALPNTHTTIIVGKNEKLRKKLSGKYDSISVIGYTDRVNDYMRKADLLISKAGGITMFEAIHSRLPLLIFQPFLEQEISNARFLQDNGLAHILRDENKAAEQIAALLFDDQGLQRIRKNMDLLCRSLDKEALCRCLDKLGDGRPGDGGGERQRIA